LFSVILILFLIRNRSYGMGWDFQKRVFLAGFYRYGGQNQRKIIQKGGFGVKFVTGILKLVWRRLSSKTEPQLTQQKSSRSGLNKFSPDLNILTWCYMLAQLKNELQITNFGRIQGRYFEDLKSYSRVVCATCKAFGKHLWLVIQFKG
jgi:hypothetical protein